MHTPTRDAHRRARLDSERGWALAWADPVSLELSLAAVAVVVYQFRHADVHGRYIRNIERHGTNNSPDLDSRTELERRFP